MWEAYLVKHPSMGDAAILSLVQLLYIQPDGQVYCALPSLSSTVRKYKSYASLNIFLKIRRFIEVLELHGQLLVWSLIILKPWFLVWLGCTLLLGAWRKKGYPQSSKTLIVICYLLFYGQRGIFTLHNCMFSSQSLTSAHWFLYHYTLLWNLILVITLLLEPLFL